MGFHELLLSACEQAPERTLVRCDQQESSFAGHLTRVGQAARFLRDGLGVTATDRIAVLSRNSRDYLELFHTAMLGAAVIVPLNVRAAEPELAKILNDSGARVCFASTEFLEAANRLRDQTVVEHVIEIGPESSPDGYSDRILDANPWIPPAPVDSDLAFIMYTSGTTGSPKGVAMPHGALANDIYKTAVPISLSQRYTSLLHAPLFHIAAVRGFGLAPAAGGTLVMLPRFDPNQIVEAIRSHGVQTTGFIATTLRDMLEVPDFCASALPTLTTIGYGSAPMNPVVLSRLMAAFPDAELVNWYGMTETCGHVCTLNGDDHRKGGPHLTSVGRPLPGNRIRIVAEDGQVLPRGAVGEITVAGDNLMGGYWNQPALQPDADGTVWYRSGDAGWIDDDGYVFLAGRAREMIITGGENVAPTEVEYVLAAHPDVAQAVVLGMPDEKWGEAVHACVSVSSHVQVSADELRRHCRQHLAGYKVPKRIDIRDTPFPMTGSHKIDRNSVVADYRKRLAESTA